MNLYIFDIDGTLADSAGKSWMGQEYWTIGNMGQLPPHPELVQRAQKVKPEDRLVVLTGRSSAFRKVTSDWLAAQGITYAKLIMRPMGFRAEMIPQFKRVTIEVEQGLSDPEKTIVFDDSPEVLAMLQGLPNTILHRCSGGKIMKLPAVKV